MPKGKKIALNYEFYIEYLCLHSTLFLYYLDNVFDYFYHLILDFAEVFKPIIVCITMWGL